MFTQFLIFGTLGMLAEVVFNSVKGLLMERTYELKGHTSVWMFPIYGLIALIFPLVSYRIGAFPWFIRGIVYMVLFYVVEYVSGIVLRKMRVCPWEYPAKYSLNGLIYFPYAPVWFLVGLGVERIYPTVLALSRAI